MVDPAPTSDGELSDADPEGVTLPLPTTDHGAEPLETAELSADEAGLQGRPASWKDRLRLRLKDHEAERHDPPLPEVSSRFEVVRELGRGGMGVVLEAEDTVLKRRVAVKILLAGEFASPQALERFQIEARAAARLRHPNIVGVLEVGEEAGRQFLVMDLIEGEALDAVLRRSGPLEATEAARITMLIAGALAFAHERGVLHRDIKPANILVTEGQPLLTDFGLAKEIERSVDAGQLTSSGHVMGTPAYMSPEQARGDVDAIGRRTDIYSLGATLYEMLVGRPPFTGQSLPSVLMAVANDEPTALSALRPGLDRDLDTICLKCLEKEPEARYASADALVADLERFLRHESIHARRPSMSERARKWLRRNRIMARTLGFSAGIALVLGVVLSGMFLQRVRSERNRYELAAAEARKALDILVVGVRDDLADVPGEDVRRIRQKLLQGAVDQMEKLEGLEQGEGLSLKTSEAYRQIGILAVEAGDLTKAEVWFSKAAQLSRRIASAPGADQRAQRDLSASLLHAIDVARRSGAREEARRLTEEAVQHARAVSDRFGSAETRLDLARVLCRVGDLRSKAGDLPRAAEAFQEAVELARRSLKTTGSSVAARELSSTTEALGEILEGQGDLPGAERAFAQGTRIARALVAANPKGISSRRDLLSSLTQMIRIKSTRGDLPNALRLAEEGLALGKALYEADRTNAIFGHGLAIVHVLRGDVLSRRGDVVAAQESYRAAIKLGRVLEKLDPNNTEYIDTLTGALERHGIGLRHQGDIVAASKISTEVLARARQELTRVKTARSRSKLAYALGTHGNLERERGDLKAAFKLLSEAVTIHKGLVAQDPSNASALNDLGSSWSNLGDVHRDREELEPALAAYRSAVAMRHKVLALDGKNALARKGLSITLGRIGKLELRRGQRAAAEKALGEALASDRKRVARDPSDADARENLSSILMALGGMHYSARELEPARKRFIEARDLRARIIKDAPGNMLAQREYLISLSRVADVELAEGNLEEARATYAEMLRLHRKRLKRDAMNAETLRDVSVALIKAGDLEERRKDREAALSLFQEAVSLMERRLALDETNNSSRRDLYIAQVRVGKLAFALRQLPAAEKGFQAAVKFGQLLLAKTGESRIHRNLTVILLKLADIRSARGDPLGTRAYLQRAVKNHEAVAARDGRHAPKAAQLKRILRGYEAKIAYLTGARAPGTPNEHLELAYALVRRKEHAAAVPHFEQALVDAKILDSPKGHRFHAARAAAVASAAGDPGQALSKKALTWLTAHVKELRTRLDEAHEHLTKPDLEVDHQKQLKTYVKKVEAHLEEIRVSESDLTSLRSTSAFKALFPD